MSGLVGLINGLLGGALTLVGTLTSSQQNGASLYGTLNVPLLPAFLTNNPLPQGFPWGTRTASGSNPDFPPTTGVTRYYDFTVTRSIIKPDGVEKNVILINGQFPGPMIEANWVCSIYSSLRINRTKIVSKGDQIQVTVRNKILNPDEGIGIREL
jgi:hypothetical protein